ncbi:hypothetical protein ABZX93_06040 [Streptomyces sp. NPDC006632]|uniref:hypothetical protein n=1 Tax=Streptomyces sp. NPDC006632 TaxID=3157182 RepID=UPI0033B5D6BB
MTFDEMEDGSLRLKILNAEDSFNHSCLECGEDMSEAEKIRILTALGRHGSVFSSDLDNHHYERNRP